MGSGFGFGDRVRGSGSGMRVRVRVQGGGGAWSRRGTASTPRGLAPTWRPASPPAAGPPWGPGHACAASSQRLGARARTESACALAGWWGVGWRSMRRWGRWTTGRRECWPRCSSCRLGRAVPCECASICAAALTSHLVLHERLPRLLLRSRRSRRQHLHSRARHAARLTRLRRQRRQKACADGDQH